MIHPGWPFKVIQEYTASAVQPPVISRGLHPPEPKVKPTSPAWPPPHFPKKLQEFCLKFQDILVKELRPDQQITCAPMEVNLIAGKKPSYARRPRRFTLHWAEKVKKETQTLIWAGIIEKMPKNESARWISPAGFVA